MFRRRRISAHLHPTPKQGRCIYHFGNLCYKKNQSGLGRTNTVGTTESHGAPQSPGNAPAGVLLKIWRNYYLQRTLKAFATIFVISTFIFFLIRLMPGNPLDIYIESRLREGFSRQEAEEMANSLFQINLNDPIHVQYADYLNHLTHLDMGKSISSGGTPVINIIKKFLPWTLFVVTISIISSFTLGIALGTLMAYRRNSWFDHLFSGLSSIISAVPANIVAILIIFIGAVELHWFDLTVLRGSLSPGMKPGWNLAFFGDAIYHAMLPIVTYVITTWGGWALSMKSNTVSTMGEDFVTVARARGLSDARIASSYVGRNAVLPLFTSLAISLAFVVGGSTFIEKIFIYNGIGAQLADAVAARDYPVMQGIFLIICASVVFANYLADVLYSWLDPRIRIAGR